MANRTAWQRLVRIARRQHGLIAAAQADEAGIAYSTLSRWTSAGRLERWYPGVYALEGMPDSWHRRAKAATLAGPAGAVLGGVAAARLHGLLGSGSAEVELLAPRGTRGERVPRLQIRRTRTLPAEHRVEVEGIPVACVARTIVELAAALPEEELRRLLLDAWRRELVTPVQVATILGEVGRVRGASTLRRVLAGRDPVLARARSVAEIVAYLTIRDAELPLPVINHRVEVAGRRFEIDLAWLDLLRGLETDVEVSP